MGQFSVEKPVAPGSALSGNQHGLGPFHLFRWAFAARFLLPQLKGAGGISEWAENCPEEETVSQNDMS